MTTTVIFKEFKNGYESGKVQFTLTSAEVLALNGTPIDLLSAPGTDRAWFAKNGVYRIDTYGGTPYATNTDLQLVYDTSLTVINVFTGRLATAATGIFLPSNSAVAGIHSGPTTLEENKKIQAYVPVGNPTAGNSDIVILLDYEKVKVG